jgi:hypothetical protein
VYASWADYLEKTTPRERMQWCARKAKRANRQRLLSAAVSVQLKTMDVLEVMYAAKGRCCHCRSLAVENRPSAQNGAPLSWEHIGRRIGSLEHLKSRISGGDNERENLAWSCLWCNTHVSERKPFAENCGGHYPDDLERDVDEIGEPLQPGFGRHG